MITTDISKFDQQRLTLVKYKINDFRKTITDEMLSMELNTDWLRGSRFNDTDRIVRNLLGSIYSECDFNHELANSKLLSLNSTETSPYIKRAFLDAAYSDYYYTLEKEY